MDLKEYYSGKRDEAIRECEKVKKRIFSVSMGRIGIFAGGVVAVWLVHGWGMWAMVTTAAVAVAFFLYLMKVHNGLFMQKDRLKAAERHYETELAAQEYDYSGFEDGKEWIDAEHPYSLDLDVFGPQSLFQCMNRTCTPYGKETLSRWLQQHLDNKGEIERRQQAVKELSRLNGFREEFRITGMQFGKEQSDTSGLEEWVKEEAHFLNKKSNRWLCIWVPVVNVIVLTLALTGLVSFNLFWLVFGCFVVGSMAWVRQITRIQGQYAKHLKVLSTYAMLIRLIDEQELSSAVPSEWKKEFESNGMKATKVLGTLAKELDRLDLRNNLMLYFVLEGSMFWQLRQMLRIEQWKAEHGKNLMKWLEALGKMDALCSLGTFAFNHPNYNFPVIAEKPFVFRAKDMGHPLMPVERCVTNNAEIPCRPYFVIITGANMAGKSTYLRAIGVNYLLACMGCPVCCASLEIYPAQLMTSLRTSDSLADNESYFFAELKRLHRILQRLENGEEMFIILDEILKGTNSKDKQKGSFALVKQLLQMKANGIIATHDLLLGELKTYFPQEISNRCFEADIVGDELTFSYKLREGVAQNMNACFLMKKMGIVIND